MAEALKAARAATFLHHLEAECGLLEARDLGDGRYSAILPLLFTHAIIVGRIGDRSTYDDRWCYRDRESAEKAHLEWDGIGEPEGWHRHPLTGRRRDAGDPLLEYIDR